MIEQRITLTPGGRTLVATMRAHGAYTCLVSGGFTLFTEIGAMIGFDEDRSNILLVDGDARLSGQVAEPILGREAKLDDAARAASGSGSRRRTRWRSATAPTTSR